MSKRQLTIQFQEQVSRQLTKLLETCLSGNNDIRKTLEVLVANVNNEVKNNDKRISLKNVLECINEPETFYYQNDALIERFGQDRGKKIYSPRVDLCIAPSFVKEREIKGRCFMNIILPEGTRKNIYESIEQIDIVQRLKQSIKAKSNENYGHFNITPSSGHENKSPLYLFGIEIENSLNSKHLMGDFINSIMLSKYPVVLVQKSQLEKTLNLIQYINVIEGLKGINLIQFSQVNLLTIEQFTEIVNELLQKHGLSMIYLSNYQ